MLLDLPARRVVWSYAVKPAAVHKVFYSSEAANEVLVALGVGMMKRKMATSVAPANVIEVADDGQFSVTIYFFTSILF